MGLDALAGDFSSAEQFPTQLLSAMLAAALILPLYGPVTAGADRIAAGLCAVVANGSDLCRADFVQKTEQNQEKKLCLRELLC